MTINIDEKNIEILLINEKNRKYIIDKRCNIRNNIENLELNSFIEKLRELTNDNKNKIKKIFFNIQNEGVVIRNLENIKTKRKKEIIELIKYEINDYMPINLHKYIIKYTKIRDIKGKVTIQAILFPKKYVEICDEISENLEISKKYLHINFDILQKVIDSKFISIPYDNTIILENRLDNLIFNKIINHKIIESYILDKDIRNELFKNESIFYFGEEDEFIQYLGIQKVKLQGIKSKEIEDTTNNTLKYLNSWGMIL